jgi:hypothetical protein
MKRRALLCCAATLLIGPALAAAQSQQPARKTEEPKKAPKKRLVADLSGFELSDPKQKRPERTVVGATRGFTSPDPLAPQRGKLYGASALFEWHYEGKGRGFLITFLDEEDNEVFRAETTGKQYLLPATPQRFQPGKTYAWQVLITQPLIGANPSEPVEFVAVSDAERAEIEKALAAIPKGDEYSTGLARARVFTRHRVWFDAIGAYTALIAKFPDRAELFEERGAIYAQLDITKPLAEADFARADAVHSGSKPGN